MKKSVFWMCAAVAASFVAGTAFALSVPHVPGSGSGGQLSPSQSKPAQPQQFDVIGKLTSVTSDAKKETQGSIVVSVVNPKDTGDVASLTIVVNAQTKVTLGDSPVKALKNLVLFKKVEVSFKRMPDGTNIGTAVSEAKPDTGGAKATPDAPAATK